MLYRKLDADQIFAQLTLRWPYRQRSLDRVLSSTLRECIMESLGINRGACQPPNSSYLAGWHAPRLCRLVLGYRPSHVLPDILWYILGGLRHSDAGARVSTDALGYLGMILEDGEDGVHESGAGERIMTRRLRRTLMVVG